MSRIIKSLLIVGVIAITAIGAARAYYYDQERSVGNNFSAGTLDLKIDGGDVNTVKFAVNNMSPGGPSTSGTWRLRNAGTIDGYLDLVDILTTNQENGCTIPEGYSGDTTCGNPGIGEGELQNKVDLSLFWDNNCDGVLGGDDTSIYNGKVGSAPAGQDSNMPLAANAEKCVSARFNWPNTGTGDNYAQGDSMNFGIGFFLSSIFAATSSE